MSEVSIEVGRDGPYHVSGGVPLVRVSKLETDQGEPVGWNVDERLEAGEEYWLCRCGHSDRKPFCSGTHNDVGFDGTEAPPPGERAERAKTLGGTGVTVTDDRGICTHAGFCANRITNVWKAAKAIDDDPELRQQIIEMVSRCPSGALAYLVDGEAAEPELPVQIAVQKDGPLLVTGGVRVTSADGQTVEIRNRMALCRCGHSKIKPLCDGSHQDAGFSD